MFSKSLEYSSRSFMVKNQVIFGVDAKIVHVDFQPFLSNHVSKNMVHKCLECGWCIAEAEEHDSGLEESHRGDEGRFPLVLLSDADVVTSPVNVKFGEQG